MAAHVPLRSVRAKSRTPTQDPPAAPSTMHSPNPTPAFFRALPPLLILALAMASGFTMMGSFSMVQEGAKAEMAMSDFQLSLVQGGAAAVPLLLFSIPIGILVDRLHRLRLLIGLSLVWTVGTLLTAMAQSVPVLFGARMLAGIGAAGALTAALSLSADICPPQARGRALLIVTLGKSLGQGGAFAVTGWLLGLFLPLRGIADAAPWRAAHYALAAISAALVLPLLLMREPARHEVEAGIHAPWRTVLAELWTRRAFLGPLFLGQCTVVMADAAASIWASPVLSRSYGLAPPDFAGWMGSLLFLTGVGGAVLGGFAADWGQKSKRRGGLLLGAVVAAGGGIPAALFPVMPTVPLFALALGALMLCGTVTGLVTSVALTVLIPNELRGLCIGAFIAIAGLIGFGLSPTLVTAISAWLGGEQHLGQALAVVGTAVSLVSVGAFWQAMRRTPI